MMPKAENTEPGGLPVSGSFAVSILRVSQFTVKQFLEFLPISPFYTIFNLVFGAFDQCPFSPICTRFPVDWGNFTKKYETFICILAIHAV